MKQHLLLLALVAVADAPAQTITIHNGFLTGEAFLALDSARQGLYAAGVVDGYLAAEAAGAPSGSTAWINDCVAGMSSTQVGAMLRTYLNNNPSMWHVPAQVSMFNTLSTTCPGFPGRATRRNH